jgi:hypothetical protein
MAKRKKPKIRTAEDRARSQRVGRMLVERINHHRGRLGLPPDPRLEVALNKTWQEMTSEERVAERARRDEVTRDLEERIAYWDARVAGKNRN